MKASSKKPGTVEEYISKQEKRFQPLLKEIRSVIRSAAPQAEEVISYQVPCYKSNGMLAGFGAHKAGCSFYTMIPKLPASLQKDLEKVSYTASTLHFTPGEKLPVALLKKIIKLKLKANAERASLKKLKTA